MYRSNTTIKEMQVFLKRHVIISVLCLMSAIIIAKYSHLPTIPWLPSFLKNVFECPSKDSTIYEWLSLLNSLSLAFIASIVTYLVIQYIPERRRAYKAFLVLKKEIQSLYLYMSQLIGMYLFEVGVEDKEESVSLDKLSKVCNVEITNQFRDCRIRQMKNGEFANSSSNGYDLYEESQKYINLVAKSISHIKGTVCSVHLDQDIIDIISTVENNEFLKHLSYMKGPYTHTPTYQSVILNFDKGLYEFIRCHVALRKFRIDIISYEFTQMTEEEIKAEKEERLFLAPRVIYQYKGVAFAKGIADGIIALEPTEERLSRSRGVLLEMLVYYDSAEDKPKEILESALRISEYVHKNEVDAISRDIDFLNCLQIKKRMSIISSEEMACLQSWLSDESMPVFLKLGAAIICKNDAEVAMLFEKLSDEEKALFVQYPIYRLCENPPVEPDPNPIVFLSR